MNDWYLFIVDGSWKIPSRACIGAINRLQKFYGVDTIYELMLTDLLTIKQINVQWNILSNGIVPSE